MKILSAVAQTNSSSNFLRAQWTYQRRAEGDRMIDRGTGLSPAFFALLRMVHPDRPISFAELERRHPRLDADDLELWLAELCRMGLIGPACEVEAVAANEPEPVALPTVATVAPPVAVATASVATGNVALPPPATMRGLAGIAGSIASKLPGLKEADPHAFGIDWGNVSLDGLYAELLAICAELQTREQPPVRLAA